MTRKISQIPGLNYNAWYLDDANVSGPLAALSSCVQITRLEGPALGLVLNQAKSVITGTGFSSHLLGDYNLSELNWKHDDGTPTATVLGVAPVGAQTFIRRSFSKTVETLCTFHEALSLLNEPQPELLLARLSLRVARVTHLLRTVPRELIEVELAAVDDIMNGTLIRTIGTKLTGEAWKRAGLPIRLRGLGVTHCVAVAPAAFISSALRFGDETAELDLPIDAGLPSAALLSAATCLPIRSAAVASLRA